MLYINGFASIRNYRMTIYVFARIVWAGAGVSIVLLLFPLKWIIPCTNNNHTIFFILLCVCVQALFFTTGCDYVRLLPVECVCCLHAYWCLCHVPFCVWMICECIPVGYIFRAFRPYRQFDDWKCSRRLWSPHDILHHFRWRTNIANTSGLEMNSSVEVGTF